MKIRFAVFFILLIPCFSSISQTLDRITLSSGGIAADSMSATIGQTFVFSLSGGGYTLDAGAQSDIENTGGGLPGSLPAEIINNTINMLVYPNPVADILNIQIDGLTEKNVNFAIYDISGKMVMKNSAGFSNGLFSVNVQNIVSGNYIMQTVTGNGKILSPFIFTKTK